MPVNEGPIKTERGWEGILVFFREWTDERYPPDHKRYERRSYVAELSPEGMVQFTPDDGAWTPADVVEAVMDEITRRQKALESAIKKGLVARGSKTLEHYTGELWAIAPTDAECHHLVASGPGGGVVCVFCLGWFCY